MERDDAPVDAAMRVWIERRLHWLCGQFGADRLRRGTVVLPTPEFFPDPFHDRDDIRPLLDRVCGYLGVDPRAVDLQVFLDDETYRNYLGRTGEYGGTYEEVEGRSLVTVVVRDRDDAAAVVATLAHELAHVLLLGQRRIDPDAPDHEPLTDLATVFFGLGLFNANASVYERSSRDGQFERWVAGQRGYLKMPAFGYALALYALERGEDRPAWFQFLRPDLKHFFREASRALRKSGVTGLADLRHPDGPDLDPTVKPEQADEASDESQEPVDLPDDGRELTVDQEPEPEEFFQREPAVAPARPPIASQLYVLSIRAMFIAIALFLLYGLVTGFLQWLWK